MGNIKIRFCESKDYANPPSELEVFANVDDGITVLIYSENIVQAAVSLDKKIAIKLSKELRRQIDILNNGK